jgi:hypothetical protein
MSRGPGKMQQALFGFLLKQPRPVQWHEIRAEVIEQLELDKAMYHIVHGSLERSLRRAMHEMVKDGAVITIGHGGRAEPFRYSLDPLLRGMAEAMIAKRERAEDAA